MFFIELDGTRRDASVARSLEAASRHAAKVRIVGEYPASQSYESYNFPTAPPWTP